jgi:hypothetical protein
MAKNPKNVEKFLEDLTIMLKKLLTNEIEILLKYKKDEVCVFFCFYQDS